MCSIYIHSICCRSPLSPTDGIFFQFGRLAVMAAGQSEFDSDEHGQRMLVALRGKCVRPYCRLPREQIGTLQHI